MRFQKLCAIFALSLFLPIAISTQLKAEQKIEWKDLLPKLPPLKDPLAALTQDQRFDIEAIQWARSLSKKERQHADNLQMVRDATKYEKRFKKTGLDVDALIASQTRHLKAVEERQKVVNAKLNGQTVRLAGYLLPLEFSDEGVHDFLLVPYVGACIHVPPPPPNQIVLVQLSKKFKVVDLYTPAWIVGKLQTKATSRALTFADGTNDIPIGYHIDGASAEAYKE